MNTKEFLLEATNNGLDFFQFAIPDLKEIEGMYGNTKFENTYNPFYNDTKPGLSIYERNERWYFRDYGDDTYSGDVFDYASHFYGLEVKSDFQKILSNMAKDLEIELPKPEYNNDFSPYNFSGGHDIKYKGSDNGHVYSGDADHVFRGMLTTLFERLKKKELFVDFQRYTLSN